jgi:transglutaminase-like putative cysteine protease
VTTTSSIPSAAPAVHRLWRVSCGFTLEVSSPCQVVVQIAPAARAGNRLEESLVATLDGAPVPVTPMATAHDGLAQVLAASEGRLVIDYHAVLGATGAPAPEPHRGLDDEQVVYRRQSRYCPSDEMIGFVTQELGHLEAGPDRLLAVAGWVGDRLAYEAGASGPLDTAADTLFAGKGVCRDFAHLAITVLRALGVPARLVAVYAPGLSPMEFHAVVEAHLDGAWWVIDPTRLAPRQSLLRVATGRDAADTAFLTVFDGTAELTASEMTATIDGDLPSDDHQDLVLLP